MKRLLAAQSGKGSPGGSAGYTANVAAELKQRCSVRSPRDWLDPAVQSAAFRCPTLVLLRSFTSVTCYLGISVIEELRVGKPMSCSYALLLLL